MLDVRNLPLELRQNAIQRLLDFKNEYVFEFSFMIRNTIEGTVGYLKQPQLKNYKQNLKGFIDYTEILDKEHLLNSRKTKSANNSNHSTKEQIDIWN